MQILKLSLLVLNGLVGAMTSYLLMLLGAAMLRARIHGSAVSPPETMRFVIVVPAHNEEGGIGQTLDSLRKLNYPVDSYEVVVVADNCDDRTATIAAAAGATVYERNDPSRRGKGYALEWVFRKLILERPEAEAFVVIDADCQASSNLLGELQTRFVAGVEAVQTDYVVANPSESWSSGLRFASLVLVNRVRPLGKDVLGLSCGLFGTGMGFKRTLLERHPWTASSLTEDAEYHLLLVEAGERVGYVRDAFVRSSMPTSLQRSQVQQLRWEGGRWHIIRTWTPRLVTAGLRHRDLARLHAGLEPLVLPQSLLLMSNVVLVLLSAVLRSALGLKLSAANLVCQAGYILGGLRLAGAPLDVYRSLGMAPILAAWKVLLWTRIVIGIGAKEWARSWRETGPSPDRGG